jgi:hypothetical protein
MNFVSVAGNTQTTGEGVPLFLLVSKDESVNEQVRWGRGGKHRTFGGLKRMKNVDD